jgi:hypothetical protein
MFVVRNPELSELPLLYNMMVARGKIAARKMDKPIEYSSFVARMRKTLNSCFVCAKGSSIVSYVVTADSQVLPAWYFRFVVTDPSLRKFDSSVNGVGMLYDAAIDYWETQGLFSFVYFQPKSYMESANDVVVEGSERIKNYIGFTWAELPPNTEGSTQIIREMAAGVTFDKPMVARIHHHKKTMGLTFD